MTSSKELFLLAARKKDAFVEILGTSDTLILGQSALSSIDLFNPTVGYLTLSLYLPAKCLGHKQKRGNPRRKKSRSLVKGDKTRKKYRSSNGKRRQEHRENTCREGEGAKLERNSEVEKAALKTDRFHELASWWFSSEESVYSARDKSSIPGSGRFPEENMAAHSSILACRIPRTEEPGRSLRSTGSQRVRRD